MSFLKNWQLFVIGILSLALSVSIFYARYQVSQKNEAIAEKNKTELQLKISQDSVKSLQGAINEQNAAVEKLRTDAEARARTGQALINRARAEAETHRRRAEDLMNVVPLPGKSICESAEELINQEIRSEK